MRRKGLLVHIDSDNITNGIFPLPGVVQITWQMSCIVIVVVGDSFEVVPVQFAVPGVVAGVPA
jgi:hypothetical protein